MSSLSDKQREQLIGALGSYEMAGYELGAERIRRALGGASEDRDPSTYLKIMSESLVKLVGLMEARSDRTLQGWKEIADYLGMSVSRAKRLGSSGRRDRMPVYSFHGRVYAKPTALDRWRTDSSVAVGVG